VPSAPEIWGATLFVSLRLFYISARQPGISLSPSALFRGQPRSRGAPRMETTVKAGRYEILGELGRGAMGVVYRATDPVIGRTVAVKTIRLSEEGTGLNRAELLSRFKTEARAAGLLAHPNIVVVYDAGEENGLFYITMELIEGKSLQSLLDFGHGFPVPRILRIFDQTCSALQFAHERNVVHRDIKPANLMLTADDTVKITDFGTAKILQFGTAQQTTHVMGTPSYMSPEQVKGRPVDGRSDIFSLGVMLYEMLTGEKPFPGQSITTVIYKIVNEEPIPPRQLNPSVHPGLNDIVMRALAKEPEERYQSCREFQDDLKNYRAMAPAVANDTRNPDATLVSPRNNSGFPLGSPLHNGRPEESPTAAALRSLQNRTGNPMQTPSIRRTGSIPPLVVEEPQKKSIVGTVLAALFLVAVIVYGVYKLRPEFQAARELNSRPLSSTTTPATTDAPLPAETQSPAISSGAGNPAANAPVTDSSKLPTSASPAPPAEKKPDASMVPSAPIKKPELSISIPAAEYKSRIEDALAQRNLTGRVKVIGMGNSLTLTGKLHPEEHSSLLHFMRNAPANIRVVDDILYDDAPLASSGRNSENDSHPVPQAGKGAIHIVTDVLGATATLFGPAGRQLQQCVTPCSFNNLFPQQYGLQVTKDGYTPLQTALAVKAGESQDQKMHLESIVKGLYVSSHPAGADIFINGAKQSGQTPATLPLAAGQYNLVLRLPGHEAYVGQVQVKDNLQTTFEAQLKEKSQSSVAWAQVTTAPKGAEILVDGNPTGQYSPARVQIPVGSHILTMRVDGFQPARRGVQVSEGGTVIVTEVLKQKQ
jgi:serine/threonine protein kinase